MKTRLTSRIPAKAGIQSIKSLWAPAFAGALACGAAMSLLVANPAHAAAPAAFAQCSVCHTVTKGGLNGLGPNIYGVVGRKAGSVPGFKYSTALKGSGKVWTPAALDKWLTNPAAFVPGSRMPYAGMADAKKRAEVIAYLKTLK